MDYINDVALILDKIKEHGEIITRQLSTGLTLTENLTIPKITVPDIPPIPKSTITKLVRLSDAVYSLQDSHNEERGRIELHPKKHNRFDIVFSVYGRRLLMRNHTKQDLAYIVERTLLREFDVSGLPRISPP